MISPLDLQNKKIVTKKKKYEKAEMDEYLDFVFENYKAIYDENLELQKKVKTLSDGIQYYRSIETTMQKALLLAEKTSKETKDAAILKAEAIEKDANTKAKKIIASAEQEYDKLRDKCLSLMQQFNQYKLQLKQVATAQLDLVTSESFDVYVPELDALQREKIASGEIEKPDAKAAASRQAGVSQPDSSYPQAEAYSQPEPSYPQAETYSQPEPSYQQPEAYPPYQQPEASLDFDLSPDLASDTAGEDLDKTMILPDIKTRKDSSVSDEEAASILTADTIDLRDSIEAVRNATVVQPVEAEPLEAQLKEVKNAKPEVLEPIPQESGKDTTTLDSLLQSMNMSNKKKKKKGKEEDPFEFLGSVDDF